VTSLYPATATGDHYAIATPHWLATEAGEAMFRAGGSAVDAALAAAATLAVVAPHRCGLGGDAIALVGRPDGQVTAVNGSGAAPRGVDPDALRACGPQMPATGPHTITVPGVVRAWESLSRLAGRLPVGRVLAPAIAAASGGVPVSTSLARVLVESAGDIARDPGLAEVFFADGEPLAAGASLRQPALARSLRAIAEGGADVFYAGELAHALLRALQRLGSPLAAVDLHEHRTELTDPLGCGFGELEVLTAPPTSQGFVLLELLRALGQLERAPDPLGPDAPLVAALYQLTSRDRERHLADPRHAPVPVEELLSQRHAEGLLAQARARSRAWPAKPLSARAGGDTVAVVAADREGNTVSLIQSTFDPFGARILDPATGVLLHNRGASFALDAGAANVLARGKRPANTLMPVLLRRDGRVVGAQGAVGGTAQPQVHAQLLLRRVRAGDSPSQAMTAPRWVLGGLELEGPDDIVLLERGGEALAEPLRRTGLEPIVLNELAGGLGDVQLVERRAPGTLQAITDPRSEGAAAAG